MPLVVLLQLAKEVIPYHALLTRHSLKHLLDTCITQYTNENLQQDNQLSHAAAVWWPFWLDGTTCSAAVVTIQGETTHAFLVACLLSLCGDCSALTVLMLSCGQACLQMACILSKRCRAEDAANASAVRLQQFKTTKMRVDISNSICPIWAWGTLAPETATGRWHADMMCITTALN